MAVSRPGAVVQIVAEQQAEERVLDVSSAIVGVARADPGPGELARRLSTSGRRMAETFTWGVILPKWESLLRDAARRVAGAPPLSGIPQTSGDGTL